MRQRARLVPAALLVAGTLALTGCTGPTTDATSASDGTLDIVAAFYPLAYAAEAVGGDAVSVTSLTPPGAEPHDIELSAAQVAEISQADLVLYIRGFQPAVDEAVDQQAADRAIDVAAGLSRRAASSADTADGQSAEDPHVWLDPANMSSIGDVIATRLTELSPGTSSSIAAASTAFDDSMTALDAEFGSGLASCASTDLVVSHEAFGYLADAYGLTQVGISGLSPEAEPSPARLREVADLIETRGVTTIYYETLVDPKVAETIAAETGATTAVLDPLEGLPPGAEGDYLSIMRENLATLVTGQGCQ